MSQLLAVFSPNRLLSRKVLVGMAVFQLVAALLFWWFSPLPILPTPVETLRAFGNLWMHQGLAEELVTSFTLNLEALALTTAISLGFAYLTVVPFFRFGVIAITKGRFLGLVGLSFVFMIITGGGHALKLALLTFGMTVFFVTSMAAVVAAIPHAAYDHARTLRMGEWRVTWEVVVRGTRDQALEALRQNAAIGWMMLTMVEGIVRAEGGLGVMLLNQDKHFHLAEVFAAQFLIVVVGLLQDIGIGGLRRALCPYATLSLERR